MTTDAASEVLFHATIVPRRSLSRRGWAVVLGGLAGLGGIAALRFALLGLWPVIVCILAEALLAAALLAVHARAGRASEVLLLEPGRLCVLRTTRPGGAARRSCRPGGSTPCWKRNPDGFPACC